jgi:lipopolysaccharide transport protein LptA
VIVAGMLYALIISLLLTLAAFAVERLLGFSRRPRRFVWLLALIAAPLLTCVNLIASGRAPPPGVTEISNTELATMQASRAHELIGLPKFHSAGPFWPVLPHWDSALCALWTLSSAAVLLGMLATSLRFRRISNRWPVVEVNGRSIKLAERIGPALFGVLRPQVILPRWILDAPPVVRSIVIAHEESHLAARDTLLLMVAQLVVALTPWNLPAWWQLRRLRFAIEVDCDARVLQTRIDPVSYGEALLAIAQHRSRRPLGTVALTEPVSQLERRIKVMLSKTPRFYPVLAGGLAALATTFVVYAAQLQAPMVTAQVSVPTSQSPVTTSQGAVAISEDLGAASQDPAAPSTANSVADVQKPAPGAPSGKRTESHQMTIDADVANGSPDGKFVWSGRVKLSLRGFVFQADQAKMDRAHPGVLVLRGKPATFTYTPSSEAAIVRGTADSIAFGDGGPEVTLTGNASLTQGDSTVAGDRLEYRPRKAQ